MRSSKRPKIESVTRVLVALCVGLAVTATAQASTARSLSPARAFADLNLWRAEAGERPVVRFSVANDRGCALHERYLSMLGTLAHPEQPGHPGYTEAGAAAGMSSVLAEPAGLPKATWVDAVYHRMSVLQPRLRVSGFAAENGYACLRTSGSAVDDSVSARTKTLTLYPWPANDATDQPLTFGHAAYEMPSPLNDAPGATSLGLLLSVNVNGPWADHAAPQSTLTAASLVADGGASVPLSYSDAATPNRYYLNGGFALLPRLALQPGTSYTAHAAGIVEAAGVAYPFSITWHFTTSAA